MPKPEGVRERYRRQRAEWEALFAEMSQSGGVTAHQVTLEHRRRLAARGEKHVTLSDLANL